MLYTCKVSASLLYQCLERVVLKVSKHSGRTLSGKSGSNTIQRCLHSVRQWLIWFDCDWMCSGCASANQIYTRCICQQQNENQCSLHCDEFFLKRKLTWWCCCLRLPSGISGRHCCFGNYAKCFGHNGLHAAPTQGPAYGHQLLSVPSMQCTAADHFGCIERHVCLSASFLERGKNMQHWITFIKRKKILQCFCQVQHHNTDFLIPCFFHLDGFAVMRNAEIYAYNFASLTAQNSASHPVDVTWYCAGIPYVLMQEAEIREKVMRLLADFTKWALDIAESGVMPRKGFYNEDFDKSSLRAKMAGGSIMGPWIPIFAGNKADGKARKQMHLFKRWWKTVEYCDSCRATNPSYRCSNKELYGNDFRLCAAWRGTMITHEEYHCQLKWSRASCWGTSSGQSLW